MQSKIVSRICNKSLPIWSIIIAGLVWLTFIFSLEAVYRIGIAQFEKDASTLRIGMAETTVIAILGRPRYIKKATYYRPTDDIVPPTAPIVEYCYSRKSLRPYELCGIYIDVERGVVVRLHPYRQPVFLVSHSILNLFTISFIMVTIATAFILKLLCLKKIREINRPGSN